jgi:hypothetical protein
MYITVLHEDWNENAGAAVFLLLCGRDMKIMKNNSTFSLSLGSSEPKSNGFLKLAEPLLLAASS